MSAIAGIVERTGPVAVQNLNKQGAALQIHGPDASGKWYDDNCGLVSNLLRVTPEDYHDNQPLVENGITIVADVRLDNRDDLLPKLGLNSTIRAPISDTALILRSYQKWGHSCLERLIGAFTFAIWEKQTRSLFLARDQRGEKTVFYHESNGCFAFASMPKGLFALPWIKRNLNGRKLAEFLVLDHSNHATTFYRGIDRLPPGHSIEVRPQGYRLKKYWSLNLNESVEYSSDKEYEEHGRELLNTCVKSNLRSTSSIGAMMSGGLDSSAVACTAARLLSASGGAIQTYTEVPDQSLNLPPPNRARYCDESLFIHDVCEMHANISPHFVESTTPNLFKNFEKRSELLEGPYRNPFNQIWLEDIAEVASQQGNNVLLTGQSGNMSFSYDGLWNLPSLFGTLQWGKLVRILRDTSREQEIPLSALTRSKLIMPLCPNPIWKMAMKYRNKGGFPWKSYSAINSDFILQHGLREKFEDGSYRVSNDGKKARSDTAIGYDYFGEFLQCISTMFGIELRDPLGDIRLLQWCLSIPESQYLRHGQPRWLATRIGSGLLPPSILNNKKRGLQAAGWAYSLEKQLPRIRQELADARTSALATHALDLPALEDLVNNWPGASAAPIHTYRFKLCRSIMVARFLRVLEAG
ncbi:asparagine synthase-related protein [Pelagicoccus sp. SDUM812002]|uniref:asparagine synthase-related protein n=1 Tax=Pelagicoccus sp. SDUM812002 TaxID=3041266 RepID=UPI00280DFE2E|nr:asparagine synthase-related protein [Pelagicoccus sp. SDUM812002]MDQ8186270.1 asparagine synthase-related protein [Pelagicoccus sp. SDUM812002]